MLHYLWPILLIIGANTLYNVCAKATPAGVEPFASLCVTYLVAAGASAALFFVTAPAKNLLQELGRVNWSAFFFGLSIICLEFGYINVFRVGWKISNASLVANIGLACILLLLGILVYKETVSVRQIMGMLICCVGLILISR